MISGESGSASINPLRADSCDPRTCHVLFGQSRAPSTCRAVSHADRSPAAYTGRKNKSDTRSRRGVRHDQARPRHGPAGGSQAAQHAYRQRPDQTDRPGLPNRAVEAAARDGDQRRTGRARRTGANATSGSGSAPWSPAASSSTSPSTSTPSRPSTPVLLDWYRGANVAPLSDIVECIGCPPRARTLFPPAAASRTPRSGRSSPTTGRHLAPHLRRATRLRLPRQRYPASSTRLAAGARVLDLGCGTDTRST